MVRRLWVFPREGIASLAGMQWNKSRRATCPGLRLRDIPQAYGRNIHC